jgi:hypothetical protein
MARWLSYSSNDQFDWPSNRFDEKYDKNLPKNKQMNFSEENGKNGEKQKRYLRYFPRSFI